ncbi:hypothetical protein GLOIN_2v1630225 [Rhizophagus irregularis DAOM 181602=DAOM 197198]|nr:hypothetical protein GLOIN_2v1630225 [Rhizophagus irregularis DAOM 181602=DAOM 197198]
MEIQVIRLAVIIEGLWNLGVFNKGQFTFFPSFSNFLKWNTIGAVIFFIYASYHQHVLHRRLASLRQTTPTPKPTTTTATTSTLTKSSIYLIPKGDWNEFNNLVNINWTIIGLGIMARENEFWEEKDLERNGLKDG